MKFDYPKCLKALKNINIQGIPNSAMRLKCIEDAIGAIQKDGKTALSKVYIGVKNYAHFSDQRCDSEYGYGPTHGSIVFRIERCEHHEEITLGADEIYLLECVRDAGAVRIIIDEKYQQHKEQNLCVVIKEYQKLEIAMAEIQGCLDAVEVEPTLINV